MGKILVADRLSWDGQGAGEQRVFQVASKGLIDWRLDGWIAHPKNPDWPFFRRGAMYAALKTAGTQPVLSERLNSSVKKGASTRRLLAPVFRATLHSFRAACSDDVRLWILFNRLQLNMAKDGRSVVSVVSSTASDPGWTIEGGLRTCSACPVCSKATALCSAATAALIVPIDDRAFSVTAWNSLPLSVTSSASFQVLWKRLKTVVFTRSFSS